MKIDLKAGNEHLALSRNGTHIVNLDELATVATTGSYNDLIDTPDLPYVILAEKTFDPYTVSDDGRDNGYLFFLNVVPSSSDWYMPWKVRYRLYVTTSEDETQGTYECEIGSEGTSMQYSMFNRFYSEQYLPSTSHIMAWYDTSAKYANKTTNPIKIGERISSSRNPTTLARTFKIQVIEATNCTVSFPNSIETYGSVYTDANYGFCTEVRADVQGLQESGDIVFPDFDNMNPVKTIEFDTASTSYYKLFTRDNVGISTTMSEVNDVVMFRLTCTGTNIYSQHDFVVKFRPGIIYPLVFGNTNTYSGSAATTGIYISRFQYPKAINNGYDWLCDIRTYNATARHMKVEVFATTENVHWVDGLTPTTYNSTYQSDGSITLYDRRGLFVNGTVYTNASTASTAQYTTSIHNKYFNSSIVKAGEPLVSGYLLYISNWMAYRISNKNYPIEPDYGINAVATSYSAGAALAYNQFRAQASISLNTDTGVTYDPFKVGDKLYLRCRMIGDKIYSDAHISNKMTPGYTWCLLGAAYSTYQVSLNTLGSMFITLDDNGMVSHINGIPTTGTLLSGEYCRRFCGTIESTVSNKANLENIEGRSVVFNQTISNGDFSNGTTGWSSASSSTISASEGVLSAYHASGNAYFGAVTSGTNGQVIKDHKYFFSLYAKASQSMNTYGVYLDSSYMTKIQADTSPYQINTEWQRLVGIANCIKSGQSLFGVRNYSSATGSATTIYIKNAMMIDLTKMFGAGNEPQDPELLKQMFPLDYYDYNLDGTLLGGTQTGFKSEDSSNNTLTNLSIPITTLTGTPSGGTSGVMFPNGLLGIGDIRDEIDFENGTAVKRIGVVDLGEKSWTYHSDYNAFRTLDVTDAKPCSGTVPLYQMNSKAYESIITMGSSAANKTLSLNSSAHTANSLWIKDTSYSDAATFKTAMSGVYLHYALATPIEYTIDTVPTVEYETEIGGTEQWLPVNTSTPTVAPICTISRYGHNVYNVQSNWEQDVTTEPDYILNRPAVRAGTGYNSIVEGNLTNNVASGQYAHAEGSIAFASGYYSHAEGSYTIAIGDNTHAEGIGGTASQYTNAPFTLTGSANARRYTADDGSKVKKGMILYYNGVYAVVSVVAGSNVIVSNTLDGENAIDSTCVIKIAYGAGGSCSHVEGGLTSSYGAYAHAEGYKTVAYNNGEHAQGKYNVSNTGSTDAENTIHSIGIGTSVSDSKNAVEVMNNGDVYIYGAGGYNGTNPGASGVKTLQLLISGISTDVSMKADKVNNATNGNFAGLDSTGNLTDSGKKSADFATAAQGLEADTIYANYLKAGDTIGTGTSNEFNPVNDSVHVTPQALGASQKAQARTNIGAQETLTSGVNIKTINGISLLGTGNIAIAGGGGTVPDISTNIFADRTSDTKTASPKAVYNEIHPAVETTQPVDGFAPNVYYDLGTLTGTVTFLMDTPRDTDILNIYFWTFDTAATALSVTWPMDITSWVGGSVPTINVSKHYEVSVLNGIGVLTEV